MANEDEQALDIANSFLLSFHEYDDHPSGPFSRSIMAVLPYHFVVYVV